MVTAVIYMAAVPTWAGFDPTVPNTGHMNIALEGVPDFKDVPAEHAVKKRAADINFASHKQARAFRSRLREGLKQEANFNGHYRIVTYGCGTACQSHFVLDLETGNIIGGFSGAAEFRIDSGLIISTPVSAAPQDLRIVYDIPDTVFFEVRDHKLSEILRISLNWSWDAGKTKPRQ